MSSQIVDGWFSEKEVMWPGQRFGLKVKEVLLETRTEFQDLMVFDSETYGRVLVLDGVIQLTERDEHAYQEAIVHLPMFAHPNPKKVLVVGGGDGGALREVCRHAGVEKVVMCELDRGVVDAAKKYFPTTLATAFNDPRVELLFQDAAEYMKAHKNEFDVIVVDCSDPVGPAETLYTSAFYQDMNDALCDGGIVCTQGECQWLHLDLIHRVLGDAKAMYPAVDYAYSCVPTYPDGQIGFVMAAKNADPLTLRTPKRPVPAAMKAQLRYYTEAIHRAAFVLPEFAESKLASVRPRSDAKVEAACCASSSSGIMKLFRCPMTTAVMAAAAGAAAYALVNLARKH